MGQRRGDGAGRAGGSVVSVSPARHSEREAGAGARDGGARLERCRPGLARQGNKTTADGVEPATTGGSTAPQVQSPAGAVGSHRSRAAAARFCRGARRQAGGLGIRRLGDVAGQRNSHPGPALPGPCGLRERVELKNHWGWGGFTTQDLKRCRLLAASVALIYNWWSLFVRLADPDQHREVITSRPLLLQAIARKTQHAGRTTLSVSSTHGEQQVARRAYLRIARFFASLREKAEQLDAVQRWYRILSEALRKYLRGRQLIPPARLQPG